MLKVKRGTFCHVRNNSGKHGLIWELFGKNVLLGKMMCHAQDPGSYIKGQGHNLWLKGKINLSGTYSISYNTSSIAPNMVGEYIFGGRSVAHYVYVNVTLTLTVDLNYQRQLHFACPNHISYTSSAKITNYAVWVHLRIMQSHILVLGQFDLDLDLDLWPYLQQSFNGAYILHRIGQDPQIWCLENILE